MISRKKHGVAKSSIFSGSGAICCHAFVLVLSNVQSLQLSWFSCLHICFLSIYFPDQRGELSGSVCNGLHTIIEESTVGNVCRISRISAVMCH